MGVQPATKAKGSRPLRLPPGAWSSVEYLDQLGDVAIKCVRQAQQNGKTRQHQTAFDVADEGDAGRAVLCDIALSEAADGSKLTEMCSEDLALFRRFRLHEITISHLTNAPCGFIVNGKTGGRQ
jgi:hypothetical protein